MRVTYRTLRVLSAVAELEARGPEPSNRAIAAAAGIQDDGQISRLLARLERLGLLTNNNMSHARGETNAWTLTTKGKQLQDSLQIDPGNTVS